MFIQPLALIVTATAQPVQTDLLLEFAPPMQAAEQQAAAPVPQVDIEPSPQTAATEEPDPQAGAEPVAEGNEIVVVGRAGPPEGDPLVGINAESYEITQAVDGAVVGPVARAYGETLPHPIRSGIVNFLTNLGEPVVFLNFLLQLKPGKAMETLGRFAINTTLGIGGLVDVAKQEPFNLPHRENGFANTLGYYGVGPGPFLFVPLAGPTTLRDLIGDTIDLAIVPTVLGRPFNRPVFAIPAGVLNRLEHRLEIDEELKRINAEEDDPYTARKNAYLDMRQAQIDELKGISREPEPLDGDEPFEFKPVRTDPIQTAPIQADPVQANPAQVGPGQGELIEIDPSASEAGQIEPAPARQPELQY